MVFEDVLINSAIMQQYMNYIYMLHKTYPKALEYIAKFWLNSANSDSEKSPIQGRLFFPNFLIEENTSSKEKSRQMAVGEVLQPLLKNDSFCSTKTELDACMSLYIRMPTEERLKGLPAQIIRVFNNEFRLLVEPILVQEWNTFWDNLCFEGESPEKPDKDRNRELRDYVIQQMAFSLASIIQNFMKRRESGYYLGFMFIESKKSLKEITSKMIKIPALIHVRDQKEGDLFYLIEKDKSSPVLLKGLGKTTTCNSNELLDLWVNVTENPEIYNAIHPILSKKQKKLGDKASFFYYESSASSESQSPRQFTASC